MLADPQLLQGTQLEAYQIVIISFVMKIFHLEWLYQEQLAQVSPSL